MVLTSLSVSVVIVTKDRQQDLLECIESISAQTVLPLEVIVVDAGDTPMLCGKIGEVLRGTPVALGYHRSGPGIPAQRNFSAGKASGDIIFFFDDDVVLDADYIERVLDVYRERDAYGVGGRVKNHRDRSMWRMLFDLLFLLDGETAGRTRMLPSGKFLVNYNPPSVTPTMVLNGCCMSFRREVLSEFKFDEALRGYAFKEDQDFSYRVSRRYPLWETPHARVIHKLSPVNRLKLRALYRHVMINNAYLFRKNLDKNLFQRVSFYWSVAGLLILSVYAGVRHGTTGPVIGALEGIGGILKAEAPLDTLR